MGPPVILAAHMKILFLISSLGAGGAERVATTLCNAWSARGDDVTLVPTYSGGGAAFYEVGHEVELITLADLVGTAPKGLRSYARRLLTLRRLIGKRKPDVIVSFLPNVNVAAILATAFMSVPLIICERNDPSSRSPSGIWEIACKLTYRFADMLTVQTDAVAVKAARLYPGLAKISVIPNPLSEGVLSTTASKNTARRILLSMGRLTEQKQVDKLIAAFAELASRFPDWDLHMYGEGPLKTSLALQIDESGLQVRVSLKGGTREPWQVMAGADAFVMTSKYEGFPNALLEAMGTGLACVVTDCPSGPREITCDGRDALLVPMGDSQGLLDALARVMGNDLLRRDLGRQARESVTGRFSLDAVIAQWDQLFNAVARAPQCRAADGEAH
jgi:GalNAc-alpha-(1->4)-GalNAc-alpha-(1->3)-diNAcBac-PP-undecaprenol alpha-1,4-N-acetyl-D-galactosaminyltransferase